jgi:hypothetical protein
MNTKRAITSAQKQECLGRLFRLWIASPELRLGQLLLNCFQADFYAIEDFDLLEQLEKMYGKPTDH